MNRSLKITLIAASVVFAGFVVWYFIDLLFCVAIATLISFPGRRFVNMLSDKKWKGLFIPRPLGAILFLLMLLSVIAFAIGIAIPVIIIELNKISEIDTSLITQTFNQLTEKAVLIGRKYHIPMEDLNGFLASKMAGWFSFEHVTGIIKGLTGFITSFLVSLFIVSFITFFLIKDQFKTGEFFLLFVPKEYDEKIKHILVSVRHLLFSYFRGMSIDLSILFLLFSIVLFLIGVPLRLALLAAIVSALLNVVPYVGPIIATGFGLFIGLVSIINGYVGLNPFQFELTILAVYLGIYFFDAAVLQPWLYSKSIKAHPLEIFTVIIIAGKLGGIFGMIIALPFYTVVRLTAREFFNKFELVKRFTGKLE